MFFPFEPLCSWGRLMIIFMCFEVHQRIVLCPHDYYNALVWNTVFSSSTFFAIDYEYSHQKGLQHGKTLKEYLLTFHCIPRNSLGSGEELNRVVSWSRYIDDLKIGELWFVHRLLTSSAIGDLPLLYRPSWKRPLFMFQWGVIPVWNMPVDGRPMACCLRFELVQTRYEWHGAV